MGGRYTLIKLAELPGLFPWAAPPPDVAAPRYNIAPFQPIMALASDAPDRFDHFLWGLVPAWAKDPTIGNRMSLARAEGISLRPSFRNAWRRRRCLIPADGFYEWQNRPGGGPRRPMYITMADEKPFAFAGLWEHWCDDKGNELRTAAIITTTSNELMRTIHPRMPVILPREAYQRWLLTDERDVDGLAGLLKPYPAEEMMAIEVSPLVNDPNYDHPECITPAPRPPAAPQLGLFD